MQYAITLLLVIFCPFYMQGQINMDSVISDIHYNQRMERLNDTAMPANDTIAEVYNIFESFFRPENFDSVEGSALSQLVFYTHDYILVQNSIGIYFTNRIYYLPNEIDSLGLVYTKKMSIGGISEYEHLMRTNKRILPSIITSNGKHVAADELKKKILIDTIQAFYPSLSHLHRKIIYHTSKFDTLANTLLGNKYVKNMYQSFALSANNTDRKQIFDKTLKIWYAKNVQYWQLKSHPVISTLTFDSKMEHVWFKISLSYRGAEVIMKKIEKRWQVVSFKLDK